MPALLSSHEFVDCVVKSLQLFACRLIVGDAVLQVILQDDLCRAAKRRTDGCQLDEDFRAVPAVLNHALDRLQMADRTGQAGPQADGRRSGRTGGRHTVARAG